MLGCQGLDFESGLSWMALRVAEGRDRIKIHVLKQEQYMPSWVEVTHVPAQRHVL